ncbi:MAG: Ig-like domain-containing protein [Candidatus Staskawiczbacteria bacterium]|nr:Ig-like domain-containing protein [Candidatus Staskawiczbacteria bacterium]
MKSIKKITIALLSVVLLGAVAFPVLAKDNKNEDFSTRIRNTVQNSSFRIFGTIAGDFIGLGQSGDNMPAISLGLLSNDSTLKSARTTYNQAVKQANTTFNTAKKTAHDKFVSAVNSASDQASRISALKTYLSDLLTAIKQRSDTKEAALQKFIDALSTVHVNQAPIANAQSVTVTKNIAKIITLTGSDPEASTLSFSVVTNPTHGTLSGIVPNLTYLPDTDYTGTDSFTFKVNDGSLNSTTNAVVSITVNP